METRAGEGAGRGSPLSRRPSASGAAEGRRSRAPARGSRASCRACAAATPRRAASSSQACTAQRADLPLHRRRRRRAARRRRRARRAPARSRARRSRRSTCGTRLSAKIVRRSMSANVGDARQREVVGGDLRALVEADVVEERHARARAAPRAARPSRRPRRSPRARRDRRASAPSWRAPRRRGAISSCAGSRPSTSRDLGRARCARSSPGVHVPPRSRACAVSARGQRRRWPTRPGSRSDANQPEPKLIASRMST